MLLLLPLPLTALSKTTQAPDAVELSLTSMSDGERAIITVTDPTLLAAPQGALVGAGIPAGTAAAVFDVTLLSFKRAKEKWEMNNQEKVHSGGGLRGCRVHGN